MRFWRQWLAALIGFLFGVWLLNHGIPVELSIALSFLTALAVVLALTEKPRRPRPGGPG